MLSIFQKDDVPGLLPVLVLVLVQVLIPDSWPPEKEQHYLIYLVSGLINKSLSTTFCSM